MDFLLWPIAPTCTASKTIIFLWYGVPGVHSQRCRTTFSINRILWASCARSPTPQAHHAATTNTLFLGVIDESAPVATCPGVCEAYHSCDH